MVWVQNKFFNLAVAYFSGVEEREQRPQGVPHCFFERRAGAKAARDLFEVVWIIFEQEDLPPRVVFNRTFPESRLAIS